MKPRLTLNTFRKLERAEETMIRAAMPRTAAADTAPLTSDIRPAVAAVPRRTWTLTKSGFTLAEVVHA